MPQTRTTLVRAHSATQSYFHNVKTLESTLTDHLVHSNEPLLSANEATPRSPPPPPPKKNTHPHTPDSSSAGPSPACEVQFLMTILFNGRHPT